MLEVQGDLFDLAENADALVITTNGSVRKDGRLVMGRGCAREAAKRWPELALLLGGLVTQWGNEVYAAEGMAAYAIVTMPVKHTWREKADPQLILRSAYNLRAMADNRGYERIVMPRPGCGNGELAWADVAPLLQPILDDRFLAVTWMQ